MSADGAHKAPVGGRVRVPLWERIAIFAFGAIFVVALLLLAVVFPKPTPFQYTVFRIVLALAAAGVATLVPGIIEVKYKTIIRAGGALAVFVIVYFFGPAILGVAPSEAPRIVISKFNIKPTDPANPSAGYEIDLYMVNRGNIIGRAPIYTVAFNSVDGFMSVADVDAEMAKVLQSAIQKPPPSSDDRDEIDVGAETWLTLPSGLTENAWKAIASGEKRFYLFVVLTYTDDTLATGQYWLSEFCASQSKDFSYFQLCSGHNRTRLHK